MYSNQAYIDEALRRGAKAYVPKEATGDELVTAIRRVSNGEIFLSPSLQIRSTADPQNRSPQT